MIAQITQAEINELKKEFEDKIGNYTVRFNQDENGKEDFRIYKGESGKDAFWSGNILLEQDYYIEWSFSLINGFKVLSATFKVTEQNKDIISIINNVYEIWSINLNKYIRGDEYESAEIGGEEPVPEEPLGDEVEDTESEEGPLSESRTKEGRKIVIRKSGERMKKLAGLH